MDTAIGGYFGLECGTSKPYRNGVYLNSGSSAFKYIIQKLGIRRLHIPIYTCRCIAREARLVGCETISYRIDGNFLPIEDFPQNEFVLYNNYFGVCGKNVRLMQDRYPNLIVDNAQAFYSSQIGRAAFYSPHKFFGVPDGGIAVFRDQQLNAEPEDLAYDCSVRRVDCMLKRMDLGAESGYPEYQAALEDLARAPILRMSKLTTALMGNIDYSDVAAVRKKNFAMLQTQLQSTIPLAIEADDIPLVYPYVTNDRSLRKRLIEHRVFVAKYWVEVGEYADLAASIIPLPIDQRYDETDMERICQVIYG